jgi:prepilin-type N-terminal cleavage/methylation domain-containing protein
MSFSYFKKNKSIFTSNGLTLIEVLIAVVIVSLIGITFFPNLRKFNSDQQFRNESADIKNSIQNAKNMFTTGTRCTSLKATTAWSLYISTGTTITTNLKGYCITTALVSSVENLNSAPQNNLVLQSSTCGGGTSSIELRFNKNGFSYSCNGSSTFTSGTFNLQLQNKNNTSQSTTITINNLGTISQN